MESARVEMHVTRVDSNASRARADSRANAVEMHVTRVDSNVSRASADTRASAVEMHVTRVDSKASRASADTRASADNSDMQEEEEHDWTGVRSLMLRNIPSRCSSEEIMAAVQELGFEGQVDYFHIPQKFTSGGKVGKNSGYAFISFITSEIALQFRDSIDGYCFKSRSSPKTVKVVPARDQNNTNQGQPKTIRGKKDECMDDFDHVGGQELPASLPLPVTNSSEPVWLSPSDLNIYKSDYILCQSDIASKEPMKLKCSNFLMQTPSDYTMLKPECTPYPNGMACQVADGPMHSPYAAPWTALYRMSL